MKCVEINNLSYSYDGKNKVIDDLTLSFDSGKYIAIVGHNGSGKSTLAKLIIRLLSSKNGIINVLGIEANSKTENLIRQKVGIVFQNPDNQFIGATVRDDIAFGLENRRIPTPVMHELVLEFAKKVSMENYLDKEPSNLSGGQKQRVAIAGVLAMKPEMIIFDEATSMLDPRGKNDIRNLILEMRKENPSLTILSITHDIEEAFMADEVAVINNGRIVLHGTPSEVFAQENDLAAINLDLPNAYKLKNELHKRNIILDDIASLDEMVEKLCR